MSISRVRTATLIIAALMVGLGVGLATGLFEDDDPSLEQDSTLPSEPGVPAGETGGQSTPPKDADLPEPESDPQGTTPGPSGPAPKSDDEVEAADAARAYVEAINDRDGSEVCEAFGGTAPDRLMDLPATRGSCAASFEASFGFKNPGGQPVWASSEMTKAVSAQIEGDSARVVATVFTEYADIREPTIEDDIIYLTRAGKRWLVIKPSATLYRSVGIAEIPLEALQPPR